MKQCKIVIKKLILTIVLISILMIFFATPTSNAALEIEDGDFYYAGSTEGAYKANGSNIFSWLLKALADVADFLLGMLTLAPRMVFVGWTALIEKALTWAVESSAGVSADGSIVENPTDLTALTDSGNNITVEAIVYNKVAALNADIFDLEFDRTISPTGHKLYCDKCGVYTDEYGIERYKGDYVENCCNQAMVEQIIANPENYKDTLFKQVTIKDVPGFCSCACGGDETCYGCSMYFEQLTVEKPTIILIKENIATWYYIIRILAMAIMLVVLIFVGIKMAISTVASDKAVYKRMLVDWVVGVIMLFTLHYFMIFVININAILVNIVQENANAVNQSVLEQTSKDLNKDLNKELAYKDLEIRVYEEIRSRAYDAKLSNGIIGMVMYMALVFMAVKYTVIYLKRLLTIMVLTLMAPGVGVAYALQKVISGKSQALKTWMTEYIMNVIIQTVHAIIYAVFISQALLLSLTNIAGMLIALIFLNYASKAEDTFKKIFKFGGKDSLLGHTENAMGAMEESFKNARGVVMGAVPAAKALTNTPYGKALKGVGKMAAVGVYKNMSKKFDESQKALYQKDISEYDNAYNSVTEAITKEAPEMDVETKRNMAVAALAREGIINPRYRKMFDGEIQGEEADALRSEIIGVKNLLEPEEEETKEKLDAARAARKALGDDVSKEESDLAEEEEKKAEENYKRATNFRTLAMPNSNDAAIKEFKKLLDVENYFKLTNLDGTKNEANSKFSRMAFGTTTFDPVKMKYVNNNDAAYNRLLSEQLFGMSDKDKKMVKDHVLKPASQMFVGMSSLFVGMGTIVTEPKVGMGLLAAGMTQTSQARRKITKIKDCKDRYNFSRFSAATNMNIAKTATEQAKSEARKVNAGIIRKRRPNFVENFKNGNIEAATLGLAAGMVISPAITVMRGRKAVKENYFPKTESVVEQMKSDPTNERSNAGTTTSTKLGFGRMIDNAQAAATELTVGTFKRSLSENAHYSTLLSYANGKRDDLEKQFKKEAVTLTAEQLKAEQKHIVDELEKKLEDEGFDYVDDKKDVLVRKETVSKSDLKEEFKPKELEKGKPSEKVIDEKLNTILQEYQQKGKLDLSSKGIQQEIVLKLESDLKAAKLINEKQKIGEVFKSGEAGLIKVIKGKAGKFQEQKAAEDKMRSSLTSDELKIVHSAMKDVKKNASPTERLAAISGALNAKKDGSGTVMAKDGSNVVSTKDGTQRVDSSKTGDQKVLFGDEKKSQAVQSYVTATYAPPKTVKSQKKLMTELLDSVLTEYNTASEPKKDASSGKNDSKNSAENVLKELYSQVRSMSNGTENENGTNNNKLNVGNKEFILDQVQAENATGLVRNLLEMMELNKTAVELDVKTGTKGYAEKKKAKSSLSIEINELEKKKLGMPSENLTPEQEISKNEISTKINELKGLRAQIDSQTKIVGPVIDIESVIGDLRTSNLQVRETEKRNGPSNKNDGSRSVRKNNKNDGSKSLENNNGSRSPKNKRKKK